MKATLFFASLIALAAAGDHDDDGKTVFVTTTKTITSCAPTVTNCPARVITTAIPHTMSTVYSTSYSTIFACPETVTNCPYKHSVTTVVIPVSTTLCPVEMSSAPYMNVTYTMAPTKKVTETPCPTLVSSTSTCPGYTVETYTSTCTSTYEEVYTKTVAVPCPTKSSVSASVYAVKPTTVITSGASSNFAGSYVVAAVLGAAAIFLV
jgi:chitinase